jgi:hypothetical protein
VARILINKEKITGNEAVANKHKNWTEIGRFKRKVFFTDFPTFLGDLRLGDLCYYATEPESVISQRKK